MLFCCLFLTDVLFHAVPAGVLHSTFASLVREAPKALLARQLLSGAAEPGSWWSCQQAFTASAAAGSIVGWLLGLGDRHMDNLLLDRWDFRSLPPAGAPCEASLAVDKPAAATCEQL